MKAMSKPAYEIRLNHIRVTVWANASERGAWFNTVVTRRYRDGEDWKDANSFSGLADLALVAEGVRLARDFVVDAESKMLVDGGQLQSECLDNDQ